MKYKILDTVASKNKRTELVQCPSNVFHVITVNKKETMFLYSSYSYAQANKFYEKKIGVV